MKMYENIKAVAGAAVVIFFALTGTASAATSIIITNPVAAGTTSVAESNDYAIDNFSDPWDFNSPQDVAQNGYGYVNMAGFAVTGGKAYGTSDSKGDPNIFLVHPGVYSAIPTGRDGLRHPISTAAYDTISFKMQSSNLTDVTFYWFYDNLWASKGWSSLRVQPGEHTYHLKIQDNITGSWSGNPIGLRFDPGTIPGGSFNIDWIKLHKAGQRKLNVQWIDTSPGSAAKLYLDEDALQGNGNETATSVTSNTSNSYSLDVSGYPAGTYYIYFEKDGQRTASVPFIINQPPLISVLDPDEAGGEDYAAAATGDPWDMSSMTDISQALNFSTTGSRDGYVYGYNSTNDPIWYLRTGSIDTNRYHRLSFRMGYTGTFDIGVGSVARFLWGPLGYNYDYFQTSDDIVVYPEWTTYTVDLKTSALQGGSIGWNGYMNLFRFDPLEFPDSRFISVDDIKLCADDATIGGKFTVRWRDDKASPRPTTVSIYADADPYYGNRNERLVVSDITSVAGANAKEINLADLPSGTYYIYLVANDGVSTTTRYATGPLVVTTPPKPPVLTSNFGGGTLSTYYPTFSWTPSSGATAYGIELLDAPPEPGEANGTTASKHRIGIGVTGSTSWKGDVHGLTPGKQYWYRVIGWNAYGFVAGFSDPDSFVTPALAKPSLLSPAINAILPRAPMRFTWSPLTGATSYAIELLSANPENANGYTPSKYRIGAAISPSGQAYINGDTTLMATGDYWWRIIGINADGLYGYFSDAWKFTVPRPEPVLTGPRDGAVYGFNSPINFTWNPVPGATDYAIELLNKPALTSEENNASASVYRIGAAILPGGSTPIYVGSTKGLSGTYYWRIIAIRNGTLWGVFSDQRSFQVR